MIDTTLIDRLTVLAAKENKINEYRKRLRVKGEISKKSVTKKGNLLLRVKEEGEEYRFTILKSHKESFSLAQKVQIGRPISIVGIPKLGMAVCTKLKTLTKGIEKGKQKKLEDFGRENHGTDAE
ncbi:MAG TPA: hypothetical protein VJB12_03740 [Candidatus Nanoarchaeia archaeon]|nr:hypothetical protein [Candidatus Nanoarchaeia archaeon]